MKLLLLMSLAGICFAGANPVSSASLSKVESSINQRLSSSINDPYDLLGRTRGTYLEGYGAVFTVEVNLLMISSLSIGPPFGPKLTAADLTKFHDRKMVKLNSLREMMRDSITSAACTLLPGLAPEDKIAFEVFLFNYSWEDSTKLPHRVTMFATKQKLVDAVNKHASPAEMAALFEEREF